MNQDEKLIYLEKLRHSTSHVMAHAVKNLFPNTKLGIGPAIDEGFYYDFENAYVFTPSDIEAIEKEMRKIINQNYKFEQRMVAKEEAFKIFQEKKENYKVALLNDIEDSVVSIYQDGDFTDLCKGPHINSTSEIKAFKLLSIAGAYWRGDEKNPMLQRIYGTAFETQQELDEYLRLREEAEKRDHRKLGRQLELFTIVEDIGPGLVLYYPKGATLRLVIEDYIRKAHIKKGYKTVIGPQILKSDVWKISGHYDYYKDNMFMFKIEGQEYGIKPMNCPGHMYVYKAKKRSYRELPLRLFELGTVHRYEKTGVLHGVLRVRGFTQDDAHIFCLPEQLEKEIIEVIDFIVETLQVFGFHEYEVALSTKPLKYIGDDKDWQRAESVLASALTNKGIKYEVQEGEGAFYGPKIDIQIKDALGRKWQCATIQCDFALPERFDLTYTDADGQEKRPVMLHRVILGSLERFMGTLVEHYAGAFPAWLAPVQVMVIPITDKQNEYAKIVYETLIEKDIRAEMDQRSEKMQYKIREAEVQKIPYMAIVGEKESTKKTVSMRSKKNGSICEMPLLKFAEFICEEVKTRNNNQGVAS